MVKFPLVNVEVGLVHFEGNAKGVLLSIHHHAATQEVHHDVHKLGLVILVLYLVKSNVVILDDLKLVAAPVAGEAALRLEGMVALPFVFPRVLVLLQLEEENPVRASDDEHFSTVDVHFANIEGSNLLDVELVHCSLVCAEGLPLPVEREYFALDRVVEGTLWKVLDRAIVDPFRYEVLGDPFFIWVVHEVAV